MYCPRCGDKLTIFEEIQGSKWLYRMYPCQRCKVIWDWASKMKYQPPEENCWKLKECRAWESVGLEILKDAN